MTSRIPFIAPIQRAFSRVPTGLLVAGEVIAFGVVLVLAWRAWSAWPQVPMSDPDTWGYLNSALSWLGGFGFRQAGGRDWFYPALLAFFLKTTGSFHGLLVWQEMLGLLSGVFMAVTWRCWVSLLPVNRWLRLLASLAGVVPMYVQLVNPQSVAFQMSIRPEAVLPCFVYAQLACLIGYCRYRWQKPQAGLSLGLGAATIVLAYACFLLKPSWYLAAGATSVSVLAGLFGRAIPLRTRLLTPVLGLAAALLLFWLPCRMWFIRDGASVTLLPLALFYVHAPLVDQSLEARLAALPDSDPGKEGLRHLEEVLKSEAAKSVTRHNPYDVLRVDPDYLLDSHEMNAALFDFAGHEPEQIRDFCMASFKAAVIHDPAGYARKVWLQFHHYFLFPDAKTFCRDRMDLAHEYQQTVQCMVARRPHQMRAEEGEMYSHYVEDATNLAASGWVTKKNKPLRTFSNDVARLALPLEVLFLAAGCATCLWHPLRGFRVGGWAALCLFLTPSANALGICFVHALDIYRYRATYGGFWLFALTAMAVFSVVVLGQTLVRIVGKRYRLDTAQA